MVSYRRYESEFHFLDEVSNKHRFPSLTNNGTIVLSVIVPAKDEEKRLPSMLDECIEHLEVCCGSFVKETRRRSLAATFST